ncbi:hypothetical protein FXV77_08930 [Sphingobacterium phlebotomi]|uniref:Neutral/alkaline non-lysosomal ceramidase N-terminal domain-containing protein n=2 Tax=Sphingobacterium phlebotomi TaxID=2605433 RepID=A0A5D4H809_9SPHI|nr:hypothetical protein FXV77_08930 [Sphingobacterium phlebotomi]
MICCWLTCLSISGKTRESVAEGKWRVGVATADITPDENIWMAGYAARKEPAQGKMHALWVKAMVMDDSTGYRTIWVSSDILGFPRAMADRIKAELGRVLQVNKGQIVLNSSHTHSGPVLADALQDIYPLQEGQQGKIDRYSDWLEKKVISTVLKAASEMEAVSLQAGTGVTRFQVNRRNNPVATLHTVTELKGPSDHAVSVITAKRRDGTVKTIMFSYACHPTVLDGFEWSGDYPGVAQIELENRYPGAVAMFFQGAAGDQNPLPRRTKPLAIQYGKELAAAVEQVLQDNGMKLLSPVQRSAYREVELFFSKMPTVADLDQMIRKDGDKTYRSRWARRLHRKLTDGEQLETSYPYPVQALTLGGQLVISLAGEAVIEYAIGLKQQFGTETFVLAYSNDVMGYIPSSKVLKEGGYEGNTSQMVYGLPAKWNPTIEKIIYDACQSVVQELYIK